MHESTSTSLPLTIGLDLGSKKSQAAVYGTDGQRIEERVISTTREHIQALLERFPDARLIMEASTASRWIAGLAEDSGHEVVIANPRSIPIITASIRKCDRNDARLLAELGQVKPHLLSPVKLRADRYQAVRTILFARQQLVRERTALISFVRAQVRVMGFSLPPCSSKCFADRAQEHIPDVLRSALDPILETLCVLTRTIGTYDTQIAELSDSEFPETRVLRQVHGVGPQIALAYVATIGAPQRFGKSRSVGAYLGLVPRIHQSGSRNPGLSITKAGDRYLRALLVSAATRILGPHGPDSDLRRYGERILAQGGQRARAKARIAVARKLAVLLHQLLRTGEVYEPLRNSPALEAA